MTRQEIMSAASKGSFAYKVNNQTFIYDTTERSIAILAFILNINTAKQNMAQYCENVNEALVDQLYSTGEEGVKYTATDLLTKLLIRDSNNLIIPITIVAINNDGQNEIDGGTYEEDHLVPINLTTSFEVADEIPVEEKKKKKKKKKSIN
jgi:hypothetical protein